MPDIDLSLAPGAGRPGPGGTDAETLKAVADFAEARGPHLVSFTAAPHIGVSGKHQPTGWVAALSEHTPITGAPGEGLLTDQAETGVTWFDVAPDFVPSRELVEGFRKRTASGQGGFSPTKSGVSAGLYSFRQGFADRHVVVVTGNDRDTATRLARAAVTAHASGRTLSLGQIAASPAYRELAARSKAARVRLAKDWANAHGIPLAGGTADAQPAGDQVTHTLVYSATRSSEAVGSEGKAKRVWLAYNDAGDPRDALSGFVVSRGVAAGFLHHATKPFSNAEGVRSVGWSNAGDGAKARPGLMPVHTGAWGGNARAQAQHMNSSDAMAADAAKRVAWDGRVQRYNPTASAVFNDLDGETHRWMRELGASPGGPVSQTVWHPVIVAVPGVDPRHMSLAELADTVENSGEPSLPVHETNTPVLHSLVSAWPKIRDQPRVRAAAGVIAGAPSPGLATALAREVPEDGSIDLHADVIRALHEETVPGAAEAARARAAAAAANSTSKESE